MTGVETARSGMRGMAAVAVLALLLASALAVEIDRDRRYGQVTAAGDLLYVRSGNAMATIALSFKAVLADVYWIRAIQHYGGTRRSDDPVKRYELLYPLLDITTSLDPRFAIAYRFGAIFLAESPPGGPGRPDQAIALLEKGLRTTPDNWRYMQDIGFVYYWWIGDYQEAARWFDKGADIDRKSVV
jgi:tetratricopeptide (TPR) repeat protein